MKAVAQAVDLEIRSSLLNIELNLHIIVMWLKNEGSIVLCN